jgi:hypothetical protein
MSTTLLSRPMDRDARRARREEVKQLAQEVNTHCERGTWDQPHADLALSNLEYHVRGIKWHIERVLAEVLGEPDGPIVLETMLEGTLADEFVELTIGVLEWHQRNLLAAELIELYPLVKRARIQLDEVITRPAIAADQSPLQRAVGDVLTAEHAGELKRARELAETLLGDSQTDPAFVRALIERGRRDQRRQVELGMLEPPLRNWRQRILGSLRGESLTY